MTDSLVESDATPFFTQGYIDSIGPMRTINTLIEFMDHKIVWPREIVFHNTDRQVVDLGVKSALRDESRLRQGRFNVLRAKYFYTALFHPNLNPKLIEVIDENFAKYKPKDYKCREDVIQAFGVWHRPFPPTTSPRFGPIGYSVVFASFDEEVPKVLVGLRSENLAVMPGVWTTSCDETMASLGGWYRTKISDALYSEMSFSRTFSDEQEPIFLGWMVPELRDPGMIQSLIFQSGANAVFLVQKSSEDLKDMLEITIQGTKSGDKSSEFIRFEIRAVDDPFFKEQPVTEILHKTLATLQKKSR